MAYTSHLTDLLFPIHNISRVIYICRDTYCKSECFTFSKGFYQQHKPLFEASCTNLFALHLAHYYSKIIWQGNNVCPMVVVVQDMWNIKNLYWAV